MKTIRCAGVPEHFNYPWQLARQSGDFEKAGIRVLWEDESGGTGAMARALAEEKIDLAIMLTEGAITDIAKGARNCIVSSYVESPLIWGVHTSAQASIHSSEALQQIPFAISRINSGSHLMAYVYARNKELTIDDDSFNLVHNLDGARHALKAKPDQLFLWEKYTTKPLVDSGEFRLIDHCPTPWPSFVVVVRKGFLFENEALVQNVLNIVARHAELLKVNPRAEQQIAAHYHLMEEDVQAWFAAVHWRLDRNLDTEMLSQVSHTLAELGILQKPLGTREVSARLLPNEALWV